MDLELRTALASAITSTPGHVKVIKQLTLQPDGTGTIEYEAAGCWIDPSAPGFAGTSTRITDEEMIRAYLLVRLVTELGYVADQSVVEVERVYKAVGRPGKGGRVDIQIRRPKEQGQTRGDSFLFIECKAPSKFDGDMKYIEGQLFLLSKQETPRPRYLVYYTVELKSGQLRERSIIVDTNTFTEYDAWNQVGQPLTDVLPASYGTAKKRRYAAVPTATPQHEPLDSAVGPEVFARLRTELHDVIWGGGGTNNNEVFVYITKLILAKIFDEKEALPGAEYRFQRLGDAVTPEPALALAGRMNDLYKDAESSYLALPEPSEGPAFDATRISPEKLAFVVGRLEGISITENSHPGDLLGDFFEQIVAQDFTQTKGQFFTPMKVVQFMMELSDAVPNARAALTSKRDNRNRPRLPYIIDPSCGAGTFLIEYMKQVTSVVGSPGVRGTLPPRIKSEHETWFGSSGAANTWARDFLFGIENNYDLGLAAKVNMVLHGDGSMNTWIHSGLSPFGAFQGSGGTNVLGSTLNPPPTQSYGAPVNEQFDLILSNPPFSIKLSEDEKKDVKKSFVELRDKVSEALFVERWYQLLAEDGIFCCVVPEAILDTSTNEGLRRFIIERFQVKAVVSLPYISFRPFTSTKTAIVLARKRSHKDAARFAAAFAGAVKKHGKSANNNVLLGETLKQLGWESETVFMAEPSHVGYKRRKNLADLPQPNDLIDESGTGAPSVLDHWRDPSKPNDSRFGFRTTLGAVASRDGIRLDPKYRWLWDFQHGHVAGDPAKAERLGNVLEIVPLTKIPKGDLAATTTLIDLDAVEGRQAFFYGDPPKVDEIGSDKVSFHGAELAFGKLEPYLGKLMIEPPQDAIGSTEWIGLKRRRSEPLLVVAYLLLLPEMCEAFRRLQSGKRHARLAPAEILDLRIEVPKGALLKTLATDLEKQREQISALRKAAREVRTKIDQSFAAVLPAAGSSKLPSMP